MTPAHAKREYEKLISKARRAVEAKESFEKALDKLQESRNWEHFCEIMNVAPTSTKSDWMC